MPATALPLLDSLSALADPTRSRMLLLLDEHELTVTELCAVLQLPQSTVSRQLKTLADGGWVSSRRDGTSRLYALTREAAGAGAAEADGPHAQIWSLTRDQLKARPGAAQDLRRLERVLARRGETSKQFFASSAGQWDRVREDLFGGVFHLRALLALLDPSLIVGDLGCGTGAVAEALAPNVAQVIGVDASEEMLAAARRRLAGAANVQLRHGALEALPVAAGELDAAVMTLVLHHLPMPGAALADAARALKPGGRLLVVDMAPHEHEEYRQQMGHVWLGFSESHMHRLLTQAGFDRLTIHSLPPAAEAKGPGLFAAAATKRPRQGATDADCHDD